LGANAGYAGRAYRGIVRVIESVVATTAAVQASHSEFTLRARSGSAQNLLRALAAQFLLHPREFSCCGAAGKAVVHLCCSEIESGSDWVANKSGAQAPPLNERFSCVTTNTPRQV
jgi:hypothetical protein